jgi:hypothetical protein
MRAGRLTGRLPDQAIEWNEGADRLTLKCVICAAAVWARSWRVRKRNAVQKHHHVCNESSELEQAHEISHHAYEVCRYSIEKITFRRVFGGILSVTLRQAA